MIDIRFIRENQTFVRERLSMREGDFGIDEIINLDSNRRSLLVKADELKKKRNEVSKKIGWLKKEGQDTSAIQEETRLIGDEIKTLDDKIKDIDDKLNSLLLGIPNLPHESVPKGKDETENEEVRKWGDLPNFDFEPIPHNELGEKLGIFDFERAAKLSGARFVILKGAGARLERALINFMLDTHTNEHGYSEIATPFMVGSKAMTGTGQLPKFSEDLFKIENHDLWLIPTAEVPVTNIHAGEILGSDDLPVRMVAHTPCFRAEAGSYGRDTTGLIRQHQFNKVELVKIVKPEDSEKELEELLSNAESILKKLEIPFRTVKLCTGDLGFSSAMTYDIEVWVPSQKKYREISSCSTFTDFQARRMGLRFRRDVKGKPDFPHTLNGSGLAVGRTVVAILENFQTKEGSVIIPPVLVPYMGGMETISPEK